MDNSEETFFGHPKGLFVLFFTEMWERFSYYGMRAILVLYIISSATAGENAGLGWDKADALVLYGWYTMMVYVMSIPGGWIADNLLGQKKTVMLGGLLLCAGHGILAVDALWAFYLGLGLIVLGVGGLKPNISTLVGGLYPQGDPKRDTGFYIFYIGINVGAFLSSLIVGYVGEVHGWHYGFGLAGIGMLFGQGVFVYGQRYLKGVGEHVNKKDDKSLGSSQPLSKIEKDRVVVLLISFLIVIVFWGAFEQAGGLMNIYAFEKVDRFIGNIEIPASVFQSVNAFFIMTFATIVASFLEARARRGKESSSLYKMALGTIIMGSGFLLMAGASMDAGSEPFGKASMLWLIGAYWLHTIGELFISPVSLSFITKLAPLKLASLMMGVYFAATGFGNKFAGIIGESAQTEPIEISLNYDKHVLAQHVPDSIIENRQNFSLQSKIFINGNKDVALLHFKDNLPLSSLVRMDGDTKDRVTHILEEENVSSENNYHAVLNFEPDLENEDVNAYRGTLVIDEVQNKQEFNTFMLIFAITLGFGIILLLFLKRLKALTHGAEDIKVESVD